MRDVKRYRGVFFLKSSKDTKKPNSNNKLYEKKKEDKICYFYLQKLE